MSNLIKKVKEEIRKGCFALYYDMSDKELTSIPDHDTYFRTLLAARDFGARTRRCECYSKQLLKVDDNEYCIYLMSLGNHDRQQFMYGMNPLAKAFGKCLFDEVFLMAEEKQFAKDKIQFRIKQFFELGTPASLWNAKLMIKSFRDLFGDSKEIRMMEKKINKQDTDRPNKDDDKSL